MFSRSIGHDAAEWKGIIKVIRMNPERMTWTKCHVDVMLKIPSFGPLVSLVENSGQYQIRGRVILWGPGTSAPKLKKWERGGLVWSSLSDPYRNIYLWLVFEPFIATQTLTHKEQLQQVGTGPLSPQMFIKTLHFRHGVYFWLVQCQLGRSFHNIDKILLSSWINSRMKFSWTKTFVNTWLDNN